jgi:putative YjhG/YagF family dehydratase
MSRNPFDSDDSRLFDISTRASGPAGSLPLTAQMLRDRPSGDLFGWTQNAGMGWNPAALGGKEFLMLSTHGGIRAADGTPIALGYHTGHWEVGLLLEAAAGVFKAAGAIPFAAACTDPCDGRSQGTTAMFDSLPFRNDAATVFRRLIRSLPTRRGVLGVATCDKGLPAMMMALAASHDLPAVLVPGGVTLMPEEGAEDAGKVQTLGVRFVHGTVTLEEAADLGCRACGSPGGGCQFLGTAATAQVVGEALGMSLGHSALAPSGHPIWTDMARRSATALMRLEQHQILMRDIVTDAAVRNAMVVFAAFGGSTNLILHLPAIAHAAGLQRPVAADWSAVNRQVPRLVDALPNGPRNHPTVQVFMAGGVPEVMLHLRRLRLLDTSVLTTSGGSLDAQLDAWESSTRRSQLRAQLQKEGVNPDDVIVAPENARGRGLTSTVCFPHGNLAPEGSVIKSTAIDPSVVGADGVYRLTGAAKVFLSERAAMAAIKANQISAGDVLVLIGRGPMGAGMEETYQITSALRHLAFGKHVAVITDARFSGVSTGACVGHISPEALAGGPIGKLRDGDVIEIVVNRTTLEGTVNLVGENAIASNIEEGSRILAARQSRPDLAPDPSLPDDTRIWAALQDVSGGTWGGAVYDASLILKVIHAGKEALLNPGIRREKCE